jgi:hypothetical protein
MEEMGSSSIVQVTFNGKFEEQLRSRFDRARPLKVTLLAINERKSILNDGWRRMAAAAFVLILDINIRIQHSVCCAEMERDPDPKRNGLGY